MKTKMLKQALNYIQRGKSIIPLKKNKRPYLTEWREFQTRRPTKEEVESWWSQWPDANIGLVTGKISGVTVIDVDVHKGGSVEGLPMTLIAKTGNGGWHYYYKYQEGLTIGTELRKGVDWRSDGGYVVAPPSETDYTNKQGNKAGGKYEFTWVQEMENYPTHIFPVAKKKADWESILRGVPDGQRNQTATQVIGKLIGALKPQEWETVAWPMLKAWNQNNTPPDDETTLRRTFESIRKKHLTGHTEEVKESAENTELKNLWELEDETEEKRYQTGFKQLDNIMLDDELIGTGVDGGMALGEFVAIAGRPKRGKTLLAAQIGASLTQQGLKILWLFYEGKRRKLKRILERVDAKKENIITAAFKKGEEQDSRIEWIEEKLKVATEQGVNVLVIDNLDFLETENKQNEYETLKAIVKTLARMAVQYNTLIILIAHVRKPLNSVGMARRPRMYDIAGTSQVERLCDFGIIVDREQDGENLTNKTSVYLEANRPSGESCKMACVYKDGKLIEEKYADNALIDYGREIGLII